MTIIVCLQVACWGNGDQGRLGLGTAGGSAVPCLVGALMDACFAGVSCGGAHTAAVAEDGSAYLWGLNDRGQLAQGDETPFLQVLVGWPDGLTLTVRPGQDSMQSALCIVPSSVAQYGALQRTRRAILRHKLAHAGPQRGTCTRGNCAGGRKPT